MLLVILLADTSIMVMVVVIACLCSTDTPNTVFDCCFAVAMAIVVVGLRPGCSIINNNNNINAFSIKIIANTTSYPLYIICTYFRPLHCPHIHVVEGLSWVGMTSTMGVLLLWVPFAIGVLLLWVMMASDMVILLAYCYSLRCWSIFHDCHCRFAFRS